LPTANCRATVTRIAKIPVRSISTYLGRYPG
jgi:hypothetical protein